jgi:hypothetical protein
VTTVSTAEPVVVDHGREECRCRMRRLTISQIWMSSG